jgi:TatD DNase family protein
MRLVDSHAHLQSDAFAADLPAVIEAARAAGVERLLVPGWDAESSSSAVRLTEQYPGLHAGVGIHPHDAASATEADWTAVVSLTARAHVVAVGETGLDYDRMHSPRQAQLVNLRRHLRLALESGKPAILHCRSAAGERGAQDDLIAELRAAGFGGVESRAAFGDRPPAVLHSFSGPVDYARAALDMGIAIAFGGLVFRRGEEASADVARLVPAGQLLVETDSPFLAPPGVPRGSGAASSAGPPPAAATPGATPPGATPAAAPRFSGRRNSPEWVRVTAEWLSQQRAATPDSIGEGLVAAYDSIFGRT